MATAKGRSRDEGARSGAVSLTTLIDHLGVRAGRELFDRVDGSQRDGEAIVGLTVRDSRVGFTRAHTPGQAQLVTPGKAGAERAASGAFSDSVVIIRMDDLAAVVSAARGEFDWVREFSPRAGLAAALATPEPRRPSRGRRRLQG